MLLFILCSGILLSLSNLNAWVLIFMICFLSLVFIVNECNIDPRKAYQCIKFLVEMAAETRAVVEQLSHFPQLWKPAVDWLRGFIDSSESAQQLTSTYGAKISIQSTIHPHITGGDTLDASCFMRPRASTMSGGVHMCRKLFIRVIYRLVMPVTLPSWGIN